VEGAGAVIGAAGCGTATGGGWGGDCDTGAWGCFWGVAPLSRSHPALIPTATTTRNTPNNFLVVLIFLVMADPRELMRVHNGELINIVVVNSYFFKHFFS
jgi:hypothetical protein